MARFGATRLAATGFSLACLLGGCGGSGATKDATASAAGTSSAQPGAHPPSISVPDALYGGSPNPYCEASKRGLTYLTISQMDGTDTVADLRDAGMRLLDAKDLAPKAQADNWATYAVELREVLDWTRSLPGTTSLTDPAVTKAFQAGADKAYAGLSEKEGMAKQVDSNEALFYIEEDWKKNCSMTNRDLTPGPEGTDRRPN